MFRSLTITSDNNNCGAKYKKTALPFTVKQSFFSFLLCSFTNAFGSIAHNRNPLPERDRDLQNISVSGSVFLEPCYGVRAHRHYDRSL